MKQLEALKQSGNKAFVAYIMGGDGGLDKLRGQVADLVGAGVSAVEIGIPFSDPVADGPVIEAAGNRALKEGVTLRGVLEELASWKDVGVPLVIMTYLNPVLQLGSAPFAAACKKAGVAGVIIPDLPFEHQSIIGPSLKENGVALVQLVTLTTEESRLDAILEAAEGFIYAVTVKGITGARESLPESVTAFMEKLQGKTDLPVYAGFGISNEQQLESLRENVDGFIVGTAIVQALHDGRFDEVKPLIRAATAPVSV